MQERLDCNTEEAAELILYAFLYKGPNEDKIRDTGISCFAVRVLDDRPLSKYNAKLIELGILYS